jgi:hypothetical protein
MESNTERGIGHVFGMIGGLLVAVGALVAVVFGFADLAVSHWYAAAGALSSAVVLFVVGALVLLFNHMGEHGWKDRPLTTGVVLVVLALVDWASLGFGPNLLAVLGGIFVLLAGVLYLIEPTKHAVTTMVASG